MNIMSKRNSFLKQGYMGDRHDIAKIIPRNSKNILDVGCGAGKLGSRIKKIIPNSNTTGIDSNPELIFFAKQHFDNVIVADLNEINLWDNFENNSFDLIIFSDVLEHLHSPQLVLESALKKLNRKGYIITCIPNIRHYSTFFYLYVQGIWPKNDRGLFDKTHLHFFTKKNIYDLFNSCDLFVIKEKRNVRLIEPWSWTNIPGKLLDFWPFRSFFTFQYIHLCQINETSKY